jgi:2'-5' RNA ligase
MKRQAAVFVTVPAEELVGDFRRRHQARAAARLLPPHVTVLPPFTRDVDDDDRLAASLAEHFATLARFPAELVRVGTFERHVWLAPEPADSFAALLTATRSRFPELVRDAGRDPVPHLTIAEVGKGESTRAVARIAEEELGPHLPFSFTVRDVGLWEVRPEGWHELGGFELG